MSSEITIKGVGDSLLVTVGQGELSRLLIELAGCLDRTPAFFKGGQVILQVGDRELTVEELQGFERLLSHNDVSLRAVLTTAAGTKKAAQALGLQTTMEAERARTGYRGPGPEGGPSEGLIIRRTVRSGQVIQYRGHVVVFGDVNAGAEVVAGGDIMVWGRLRGMAHAGAMGDDEALVCALDLIPTQLRIGNHIARPPDERREGSTVAEIARVRDGRIVVEPWK